MRLIFMGTPAFAVPTLAAVHAAGHDIACVYTRAPKPAGRRGLDLTPSPVQVFADRHGIPVLSPKTVRGAEAAAEFAAHRADGAVVVAYGLVLPLTILDLLPLGCLNLHPSLLPRWRGAAPIQRAVMSGDTETAACIMRMEEGLDTGPVGLSERVVIPADATAGDMHDRLAEIGARLMVEAVAALAAGTLALTPQSAAGVVYAEKIDKAEARLDWTRPAAIVHDKIRGLSPFPGAYFEADFGKGTERVKVLRSHRVDQAGVPGTVLDDALTIACGDGAVRLLTVQRAGKAPMDAAAFLRGTSLAVGSILRSA